MPDIDGNSVVWIEEDNGAQQLWITSLVANTKRQLTTVASTKIQPRISGTRIVWADNRSGNLDIYGYDLSANQEELVVGGAGDQMLSDIDGDPRGLHLEREWVRVGLPVHLRRAAPPAAAPSPAAEHPAARVRSEQDHPGREPGQNHAFGTAARARIRLVPGLGREGLLSCVENGLPNGSQRTAHLLATVDWSVALSPANFMPESQPPHYVATRILEGHPHFWWFGRGHDNDLQRFHRWAAMLFGAERSATVTISVRVAK